MYLTVTIIQKRWRNCNKKTTKRYKKVHEDTRTNDAEIAYAVGVLYDLAAYMRPQWLDGEDTGMTLEVYFGDSICQTRSGFVTMDKKGYSFDLED